MVGRELRTAFRNVLEIGETGFEIETGSYLIPLMKKES